MEKRTLACNQILQSDDMTQCRDKNILHEPKTAHVQERKYRGKMVYEMAGYCLFVSWGPEGAKCHKLCKCINVQH